jgi:hypothetical protein
MAKVTEESKPPDSNITAFTMGIITNIWVTVSEYKKYWAIKQIFMNKQYIPSQLRLKSMNRGFDKRKVEVI